MVAHEFKQDALTVALWPASLGESHVAFLTEHYKRQTPPDAPKDELGRKHQAAQSKQRAAARGRMAMGRPTG